MKKFEVSNVYGAIILDSRNVKSNGLFPIKYRITYNRMQVYFKSGFDISMEDWERMPKTKDRELKRVGKLLEAGLKRIEKTVESICLEQEYSHAKLKTLLKSGKSQKLISIFQIKIDECNANGQVGTASIYGNAQSFFDKYAVNTQLSQINKKWLQDFEKYALNESKLSATTLAIYLRCLRAVYNLAISKGIVKGVYYPFARNDYDRDKFTIKEGDGTKIALTIEQVKAIKNYIPTTRSIERSRDLFLLMFYLAGINFKDLCLLKWDNLVDNEIAYVREKTKETSSKRNSRIVIPLIPEAKKIIEKYGIKGKEGYILPFMIENPTPKDIRRITTNKISQINKHLAIIDKELQITKGKNRISTYVARHSYATIMKNKGVSVAFISESLGHASIKTTENYLKSFEKEQRAKTFEVLSDIMNDV